VKRRMRRVCAGAVALVLVSGRQPALACTVCFGASDSPLLSAARAGVIVMVAVTLAVLVGFARWFLQLRRLASGTQPLPLRNSVREPR
jgi:hypothetical protein